MLTTFTEEALLLKRAQDLDSHALVEIHDRYYPEIYRYAYSRTGDKETAEDITGEVFLRLLNALHGTRPPQTTLRGWLFGVASHLVVDHYRSRSSAPVPLAEDLTDGKTAQAIAEQNLRHAELDAAMGRLKPEHQEVLALRFGEGFSVEETAHLMNRSVNAIKVLQFRAVEALRRAMAEVDDD